MTILIDSNVLIAFANKDDIHHKKAVKIIGEIAADKSQGIITDYVFDEVMSVISRKSDKKKATDLGNLILDSEFFIYYTDKNLFFDAWKIFKQENFFSFTDCTLLAFMNTFKIQNIATFDKEFKKIEGIGIVEE